MIEVWVYYFQINDIHASVFLQTEYYAQLFVQISIKCQIRMWLYGMGVFVIKWVFVSTTL